MVKQTLEMDENQPEEEAIDLVNASEDTAKLYIIDDDTNEWVDSGCGRIALLQVCPFFFLFGRFWQGLDGPPIGHRPVHSLTHVYYYY